MLAACFQLWALGKNDGLCVLGAHIQLGSFKTHFWVAQAVLRSPTQMQLCTDTTVLPPRLIPASWHYAPEDCVPRARHHGPVGLDSWIPQSHWDSSASLALLFLRRNWQQESMLDLIWVCSVTMACHQSSSLFMEHWVTLCRGTCAGSAGCKPGTSTQLEPITCHSPPGSTHCAVGSL